MKYLFALLFFVFWSFCLNAQNWKELSQAPINLKYKIPKGWYVGGFTHGKACICTGGTINTAKDRSINMVIFSSNEGHVDMDSLKNQKIWGYSFAPPAVEGEALKTNNFEFEKTLSTWNEDKQSTVLRFATSREEFTYLVYFWGAFNDITDNSELIEFILNSIETMES